MTQDADNRIVGNDLHKAYGKLIEVQEILSHALTYIDLDSSLMGDISVIDDDVQGISVSLLTAINGLKVAKPVISDNFNITGQALEVLEADELPEKQKAIQSLQNTLLDYWLDINEN